MSDGPPPPVKTSSYISRDRNNAAGIKVLPLADGNALHHDGAIWVFVSIRKTNGWPPAMKAAARLRISESVCGTSAIGR